MATEELNCWERCSQFIWRRTIVKEWLEQFRQIHNEEETVNRKEVCNLCTVVTEIFEVLSLFGVTQCYSYSKIKSSTINCNSAWRISNKSSVKSRTHKLFVASAGKHATICFTNNNFYVEREETDVFRRATLMRYALRMLALILGWLGTHQSHKGCSRTKMRPYIIWVSVSVRSLNTISVNSCGL
jgi:protein-arginine kinase activator protein McsA